MTTSPYFSTIDLSGLAFPDFIEAFSYEEIRAAMIADLVRLEPNYTVLESDPAIKIIEACAYREMLLRQRINEAALGNTITQSRGADLEVIGAFVGVAKLEGEDDDRFRSRIQQGLSRLSAAGPRTSYIAHAMAVSTDIVDVSVVSPDAGQVVVSLLAFEDVAEASADAIKIGQALFSQPENSDRILVQSGSSLIEAVRDHLNEDDVRPLTDMVAVRPAHVIAYKIFAKLVIYPGPDATVVKNAAMERLNAYLKSIRKLGYDSTRAGLIGALGAPGVQNVILEAPTRDIVCSAYDVAVATSVVVEVERVDV